MFTSINELNMLFTLGLFSGYELTVFNKIGGTSVNNAIMTGNLKKLFKQRLRSTI
ncbi:hypothetical protein HMPREF0497_0115 [Lentilactobacillus buchneri ATCC 11577]|uniref:Uncharacterized protein n=1 Tax=Lentilactobacillus hilgardii (strain ATCC 8290 / DSM 20176 / CCUG 30140 / JCM 1155 / KCTC 3500 / NBRC 15886 / NCIMB 8040 / NRRL B-1843 / 9) TaxID=1423757 RepID=C0XI33_LENH9|nr:hypothetical protein HMPREF0497_0115 [Lentilactobacillus buchneri ATCC 11577]EEI24971.1 hypothetical protein HMPREF0519_0894 [Lentilactobacillus hilgardii DSM 20176 = ATCC 8290]KRK56363.1 hypothetical protein FD42_GL000531 [Lentilactobacillus hilgardii DSM 20176 = ATCC 8290]